VTAGITDPSYGIALQFAIQPQALQFAHA
jgi:hypothetical protein